MPRGAKPKDVKHGRTPVVHEFTQVPNRPFRGKKASLPPRRTITVDGRQISQPLHAQTRAWWNDVSSMPHCVLWTATDWRYAVETALIADMLFTGDRVAAAELRLREKVLGTTLDARRDLRIRYVDADAPAEPVESDVAASSVVTNIDERRRRLS